MVVITVIIRRVRGDRAGRVVRVVWVRRGQRSVADHLWLRRVAVVRLRVAIVVAGGAGVVDLFEFLHTGSAQNAPHVFAGNVTLVFAVDQTEGLKVKDCMRKEIWLSIIGLQIGLKE